MKKPKHALNAEFELHFGTPPPMTMVSAPPDHDGDFGLYEGGPIRVLWIDLWLTQLVPLLDTHVVRLERIGGQFLFLATPELAERLLVQAPNFRNRLTDIMRIVPDDLSGSVQH